MRNQVIRARAPLRIGLGGGGTDVAPYSETFGGVVLNATIDLYAHVTIELRDDGLVEFRAPDRGAGWIGPAALPLQFNADSDLKLVRGVYNRMCAQFNGGVGLPLIVNAYADVPSKPNDPWPSESSPSGLKDWSVSCERSPSAASTNVFSES